MKKSLIAILMTVVISLSLVAPLILTVKAAEPAGTYTTVNGVLNSDYYMLYPYAAKSLNVGFSKYGELIGINETLDKSVQANWVGLEYGTRDPFCPAVADVPMASWINGWYIDIQYIDPALPGVKRDRHLWAFAMFSDGFNWGSDWVYATTPGANPGYGRQTNGYCVTDPLTVLYNGPREYIAVSRTHIYDVEGAAKWQVVDVAITLRFDKVMKEVTLYKDIKLLIPKMHLWGKLDVQFSNREEYDLGPYPTMDSYAHFYRAAGVTSYGPNWQMAQKLLRENVTHFLGNGVLTDFVIPTDGDLAADFMKVWINGVFVDPSKYTVDWATKTIHFAVAPPLASDIEVHYKYVFANEVDWNEKYDIAQIISSDGTYVAWSGMWPLVSDYTVDGILRYLDPLVMVNEDDCIIGEPRQSPLLIGEWDFLMDHTDVPQFRCVEVKGVSDRHDAQDADHGGGNVLDREAMYQLDAVFKPWDLYNAVEKQTKRWVEWKTSTLSTYTTTLAPCVYVPTSSWDQYGVFSERVINTATGKLLNRWNGDYGVTLTAAGKLSFTGLPSAKCKILFSTKYDKAKIVVLVGDAAAHSAPSGLSLFANAYGGDPGRDAIMFTADDLNYATVIADAANMGISVLGVNYLNGTSFSDPNFAYIAGATTGAVYNGTTAWDVSVKNQVISKIGSIGAADVVFIVDLSGSMGGATLTDLKTKLGSIVDSLAAYDVSFGLGTFVDYPAFYSSYGYFAQYGVTPDYAWNKIQDLTADGVLVKSEIAGLVAGGGADGPQDYTRALYESQFFDWSRMGRYEWIEVGNNSATIDDVGASLVSEAFDSYKDIGIGIAGVDMFSSALAVQSPNIMGKMPGTSAEVPASYIDSIGRAALADDWCTYWPVASSNIIGVGGAYANLFAYYANDFEDAFFGMPPYAGSIYSGYITGIPCWNRGWRGSWNVYSSNSTIGYAVISTTIDINGTELFNVYGHWGRDTYYVCQWLHGDEARDIPPGIMQLQQAPSGLTSIILQINYTDPAHPTFRIVECLGTISERLWYHYTSKLFWTGIVLSTGESLTTPPLQSGKTYRIEAREIFWYDYANKHEADAMYYTTDIVNWNWPPGSVHPAPDGHSFLQINGADVNWGPFSNGNTGHTYSITYIGQGTPITFRIVDWIDGDYTNNNCRLPLIIYIETAEYKGGIHDP